MFDADSVRFCVLEHDHPFLHWDLLIQNGETLDTWRLFKRPQVGDWIRAEVLPAHRLLYLYYEGPVSNNRGNVVRISSGQLIERPTADSQSLRTFDLLETQLATKAFCRTLDDLSVEWRFE